MFNILIEVGIGFMVGLSGVTFPGPVFIFILQQSLVKGFKSGFIATVAHSLVGLAILVMVLITGISAIFGSPAFQLYMGLVGGLSLIALGLLISKNSTRQTPTLKPNDESADASHPFIGGVIVSISNPAFFLWWAIIGLPMLGQARDFAGMMGIYAWTAGILTALFLWYGGISFIASRGKNHIPSKLLFSVSTVCGLFLILTGVFFVAKYCFGVI